MPIVSDGAYQTAGTGGTPTPQRSAEFNKWLSNGVGIICGNGGVGSGTIIYADDDWAYIQSCSHLWNKYMDADYCKKNKPTCTIRVWYHNETKLSKPKEYIAEILYSNYIGGQDCSLLRFKADWRPNYVPIAPEKFQLLNHTRLHSIGCDGSSEVAHYDVKYIGDTSDGDYASSDNSPRPGRSGGGLFSEEYYVGICWGTSKTNGTGTGFYTSLKKVRAINNKQGFGWLNEVGISLARKIPIIDRNNPQGTYPHEYIQLPKSETF